MKYNLFGDVAQNRAVIFHGTQYQLHFNVSDLKVIWQQVNELSCENVVGV